MERFRELTKNGARASLLGIGPMSRPVIRASLLLAKERDFPLMLIASRNQIDSEEFGRGYVCGWDQTDFVREVRALADEVGFDGLCYICRDHGGPWQRDQERADRLPAGEAMTIAKCSYLADMKAGFDLLHIDPTKDPHITGIVPLGLVIDRTVELIGWLEGQRAALGLPPVGYEVGTEETNGGLTSEDAYADFIEKLTGRLKEKGLPIPCFIVGQTGTLTRLTENVGSFNADSARRLSEIALRYGVCLKEHNGDYLSDFILYTHPVLGISAMNVAPEFGTDETRAYLMLAELEQHFAERGLIRKVSGFPQAIRRAAVESGRWRKWMTGGQGALAVDEVMQDEPLVDAIVEIAGHYTFELGAVSSAMAVMAGNLKSVGLEPEKIVLGRLKRSITRYVECLNLTGLTSALMK